MRAGVAESLLALVFGDVAALGGEAIMRDAPQTSLAGFDEWVLVDLLVDRFPDVARPSLRFDVRHLVDASDGDPLELLWQTSRPAPGAPAGKPTGRFPLPLFGRPRAVGPALGFEIADPHLHSGAIVPLELAFSALASRTTPLAPGELRGLTLRSAGGEEWDVRILFAAVRWAFRLLRHVADRGALADLDGLEADRLNHRAVACVRSGSYWQIVKIAATKGSVAGGLSEAIAQRFEPARLCDVGDVFWRVARAASCEFPGRPSFVVGLVRACAALASVMSARRGDGLSRFVGRFEAMKLARDAAVGELKAAVVAAALDCVAPTGEVVGAELRKTISADSPEEFGRILRTELIVYHRAFEAFVARRGRPMALSMPVGLQRRPSSGSGGDWTDLAQLRDAVTGYRAVRALLRSDQNRLLERSISAFDVAGDELGSASWPYAVAAELFRRAGIDLAYTIHAGEDFSSQLNGVRRVGELFLAERKPDRIGHALALSETSASAVCAGRSGQPVRVGDVLVDVMWSVSAGCGDERSGRDLLHRLVRGPGGRSLDLDAWVQAFACLHDVDEMLRRGILRDTQGDYGVADQAALEARARVGDSVDRALAALVWGAGVELAHCDAKALVGEELREQIDDYDAATRAPAREHVLALVREHRVTIEACPTANIRLSGLSDYRAHPLWEWVASGVSVAIGSDSPLMFGSTILDEFHELLAAGHPATVARLAATTVGSCSRNRPRSRAELDAVVELLERASPAAGATYVLPRGTSSG